MGNCIHAWTDAVDENCEEVCNWTSGIRAVHPITVCKEKLEKERKLCKSQLMRIFGSFESSIPEDGLIEELSLLPFPNPLNHRRLIKDNLECLSEQSPHDYFYIIQVEPSGPDSFLFKSVFSIDPLLLSKEEFVHTFLLQKSVLLLIKLAQIFIQLRRFYTAAGLCKVGFVIAKSLLDLDFLKESHALLEHVLWSVFIEASLQIQAFGHENCQCGNVETEIYDTCKRYLDERKKSAGIVFPDFRYEVITSDDCLRSNVFNSQSHRIETQFAMVQFYETTQMITTIPEMYDSGQMGDAKEMVDSIIGRLANCGTVFHNNKDNFMEASVAYCYGCLRSIVKTQDNGEYDYTERSLAEKDFENALEFLLKDRKKCRVGGPYHSLYAKAATAWGVASVRQGVMLMRDGKVEKKHSFIARLLELRNDASDNKRYLDKGTQQKLTALSALVHVYLKYFVKEMKEPNEDKKKQGTNLSLKMSESILSNLLVNSDVASFCRLVMSDLAERWTLPEDRLQSLTSRLSLVERCQALMGVATLTQFSKNEPAFDTSRKGSQSSKRNSDLSIYIDEKNSDHLTAGNSSLELNQEQNSGSNGNQYEKECPKEFNSRLPQSPSEKTSSSLDSNIFLDSNTCPMAEENSTTKSEKRDSCTRLPPGGGSHVPCTLGTSLKVSASACVDLQTLPSTSANTSSAKDEGLSGSVPGDGKLPAPTSRGGELSHQTLLGVDLQAPSPGVGGLQVPTSDDGDPPAPRGGDPPAPRGGDPPAPRGGDPPAPGGGDPPAPGGGDPPAPGGGDIPSPGGGSTDFPAADSGEEDPSLPPYDDYLDDSELNSIAEQEEHLKIKLVSGSIANLFILKGTDDITDIKNRLITALTQLRDNLIASPVSTRCQQSKRKSDMIFRQYEKLSCVTAACNKALTCATEDVTQGEFLHLLTEVATVLGVNL